MIYEIMNWWLDIVIMEGIYFLYYFDLIKGIFLKIMYNVRVRYFVVRICMIVI